jgi:type II secretory pathway pseudopilin PulG
MRIYSNNKIIRKGRLLTGFTLVEMLVSIAVFMSVMVVAMGSLISIINANRKSQAIKNTVDNITFVLDSISRKVQLGDDYICSNGVSIDFSCSGDEGCNCSIGGNAIQYYDKNKDKIIQYVFIKSPNEENGDGNIQQRICDNLGSICGGFGDWQNLTGPVSNVNIKNMTFYVLGVGANDDSTPSGDRRQPRIIITAEGLVGSENSGGNFMLQTSISKTGRQYYND